MLLVEVANNGDGMVMDESHVRRRVRTARLWLSPTMEDLVVGDRDTDGDDGGAMVARRGRWRMSVNLR